MSFEKMKTITLMCCLPDLASVNIKDRLLELEKWTKVEVPSIEKMKESLEMYPISASMLYAEDKELTNYFTEVYEFSKNNILLRMF